jgi:hypothetical protein
LADLIKFPFEREIERRAAEAGDTPPDTTAAPDTQPASDTGTKAEFQAQSPIAFGVFVYLTQDGKFALHLHQTQSAADAYMLLARAQAQVQARMSAEITLHGLMGMATVRPA